MSEPATVEPDQVVDVDAVVDHCWQPLLGGTDASLFSAPRWLSVLQEVYGFEFRARVRTRAGRPNAAFLYSIVDDPRGERLVSVPFCDLNDPVVADEAEWIGLTDDLFAPGLPLTFRTREHPALMADPRLDTSVAGVWHEMIIDREPAEALAGFGNSTRKNIRKAPRRGIELRRSTSKADLRAFFELHIAVRKYRHGLLAQPFALFESIAAHFLDVNDGTLIVGHHDGTFVGGCVVLVEGDTAFYKFAASHPDYRSSGISHAALFEAYRYAHERGLRALDLGRSDLDGPGLVEFKRRFRPVERRLATHRTRAPVNDAEMGPLLAELTALFVREDVPDSATESAGRLLYRFFA